MFSPKSPEILLSFGFTVYLQSVTDACLQCPENYRGKEQNTPNVNVIFELETKIKQNFMLK